MIKKTASVIFLLLGTTFVSAGDAGVSYKYEGKDWPGTCATGLRQSPIDIPKGELEFFNTSKLYNTFLNTPSIIGSKVGSGHRILQNDSSSPPILAASGSPTPISISTTCKLSKTSETSTTNGFCCASLNRNTTAAVIQVLAPVHFHNHSFTINQVEYSFNCNF
jgi:hypothetical protein